MTEDDKNERDRWKINDMCVLIHNFASRRGADGLTVIDFVNRVYNFHLWSKDTMRIFKILLNDDYFVDP